jgi:L-malate glycosyltransferase
VGRSVYYFTDSGEFGGAERALLLLIEHLDRNAWEPTLLYNDSDAVAPLVERALRLGAHVVAVPPTPFGLTGARRVPAFVGALRRAGPAVFHAHLSWPLSAKYPLASAVLARVPAVVATVHLYPSFTIDRSSYVQERLLAAAVGRYVAVSHDIADKLAGTLGWPRRKIDVIHNGVALDRLRRPVDRALRLQLCGGTDRPILLTTARLTPQKGVDVLLRAAVHLPDVRSVIAGDGPERLRLEAEARSLGLGDRVLFLGERSDVPELLAASDVFVLSSFCEGLSLSVLEAMASAKPVVASAIRGTDELVVDGESGLLVRPGDPEALAHAVRRVLDDSSLGARLARLPGPAQRSASRPRWRRSASQPSTECCSTERRPVAEVEQLAEAERNKLLRRVDWRFLLEQENEPATICFASGSLARAVARVFPPAATGNGKADLAVLVNPTRQALGSAWAALRPGGEVYAEWYVPVPGAVARTRKRLKTAGFADVRSYWPWPWPGRGRANFWLPLDAPAAIDCFLRSRPDARRGRLRHSDRNSLARCGARRNARAALQRRPQAARPAGPDRGGHPGGRLVGVAVVAASHRRLLEHQQGGGARLRARRPRSRGRRQVRSAHTNTRTSRRSASSARRLRRTTGSLSRSSEKSGEKFQPVR